MSGTTGRSFRPRVWGRVGVAVVMVIAGVLFTANARLSGGVDARQPLDLTQLLDEETTRSGELQAQVDEMQAEVDALTDAHVGDLSSEESELLELTATAAGRREVTGPGITIQLWDAPDNVMRPDWVTNDYLVVHQQDLQAVINNLWAGGAEAMTLQGQRVISTSAFRCVGNVLRLHGQIYSPPYEVQAIGNPDELLDALDRSPDIQTYLDYVKAIGLGWSVTRETELTLGAYSGDQQLQYAFAIEDGDTTGGG